MRTQLNGLSKMKKGRILQLQRRKWRNQHFEVNTGNGAPTGIALTALAYDKYVPNYKYNAVTHETVQDDCGALKDFVIKTKDSFTLKYDLDSKSFYHGIEQQLQLIKYWKLIIFLLIIIK